MRGGAKRGVGGTILHSRVGKAASEGCDGGGDRKRTRRARSLRTIHYSSSLRHFWTVRGWSGPTASLLRAPAKKLFFLVS